MQGLYSGYVRVYRAKGITGTFKGGYRGNVGSI